MKIRKIDKLDAELMLDLNLKLDSESDFMLYEPGERSVCIGSQKSIIEGALEQKGVIWLVAEAENGSIQGYCVLSANPQNRVKHVASLVIGIAKESWAEGIGTALINSAIQQAEDLGIIRIELTVRSDNDRAIALYKKLGFLEEGVRRSALNIEGKLFDELYMAKI